MQTTDKTTSLGLLGIDHLEWWVGNARAFAGFLAANFGFSFRAYAGPETGHRNTVSYLMEHGEIRFVVTGGLAPGLPVTDHVREHGDGVHAVNLRVQDCEAAYALATERGADGLWEPKEEEVDGGRIVHAAVRAYGDTVHTFIQREGDGAFWPGFERPRVKDPEGPKVGLLNIDHVVANVEDMKPWVSYYETIFGFTQMINFTDEDISTEYSALMSTVVEGGNGKIVLPINEPATGKRKSQIEEYLQFYRGPGVQHIAMRTDDIVTAVRALRARGVRFLRVPAVYYDEAKARMKGIDLPWEQLADLGILVDRDHDGHLLQIFTENICDRPTVFFEIIQREGSRGFGAGNFKALFQAIEREQEARGNL